MASLSKPKRITNRRYLRWVKTLHCAMATPDCYGQIDAHHVVPRSLGGSDYTAIPLCRKHHDEMHSHPDRAFGQQIIRVMEELWKEHRRNEVAPREASKPIKPFKKKPISRGWGLYAPHLIFPVVETIKEAEELRRNLGVKGRIVRCQVKPEHRP